MLTEERQLTILDRLEMNRVVKIQELVKATHASETTVRRDLQELENQGLLKRVHGGAIIANNLNTELDLKTKAAMNRQEKLSVAKHAVKSIQPEEVIYIDSGTATYEMLPFLKNKNIRIVTNSIAHAHFLNSLSIPTTVLGGRLKLATSAIVGQECVAQMKKYHFSKAFIGVNGIHHQHGLTTPEEEEAFVKTAAIQQSAQVFILADHTKFEKVTFVKFAELTDGHLLTDYLPGKYKKLYPKTIVLTEVCK
ncbi:DeoR/GlpR family DNA-binding transcription regulator [Vagococcus elongatus]|nr:DeoR/GlpR family DNA-binding transcription regulator [Vagococcus elongatus]